MSLLFGYASNIELQLGEVLLSRNRVPCMLLDFICDSFSQLLGGDVSCALDVTIGCELELSPVHPLPQQS